MQKRHREFPAALALCKKKPTGYAGGRVWYCFRLCSFVFLDDYIVIGHGDIGADGHLNVVNDFLGGSIFDDLFGGFGFVLRVAQQLLFGSLLDQTGDRVNVVRGQRVSQKARIKHDKNFFKNNYFINIYYLH